MNYAFRVHATYKQLESFISRLSKEADVLAVYEHNDAKRLHIHGYVEGLRVSTDTCKNWIKKALNVTTFPKADWEFATKIAKGPHKGEPVNRDALIYYHKGKHPILFNKGFSEEFVKEQHLKSFDGKSIVVGEQVALQHVHRPSTKPTKWDIINSVHEYLLDNHPLPQFVETWSRDHILKAIRLTLKIKQQAIGIYKVIDLYDAFRMAFNDPSWDQEINNILDKRYR